MMKLAGALWFLLTALAPAWAAGPMPRAWLPQPRTLSPAIADADPRTYEILCPAPHRENFDTHQGILPTGPCDVGLEWTAPQTLGQVRVQYVTLGGVAYEPALSGQTLQYFTGQDWRDVAAHIDIDYRASGEFAPLQGSGTTRWTYRFAPVTTTRVRLLLTQPRNQEVWHRLYAVRELQAAPPLPGGFRKEWTTTQGALPAPPAWLDAGADLGATAHFIAGNPLEARWPRPLLVNRVEISPSPATILDPRRSWQIEWWDGAGWRDVQGPEAVAQGVRFLPIAAERLRVRATGAKLERVRISLDAEAERYFREVEQSTSDVLGARFRSQPRRDLGAMRSLLLPLDFARIAIGRPADEEETHVAWNGTFFMVENATGGVWIMQQPRTNVPLPRRHDRWFALASGDGKDLWGSEPDHGTRTRYLDGFLPATVTTHDADGVRFQETLYVTAPGDAYGTVLEVEVKNTARLSRHTALTLLMGRRRNLRFERERAGPLSFTPEATGYALGADRHAVRSATGEVILWAETEGLFEGTPYENHLRYPLALLPGQSRTLRFFVPHVNAPLREAPRGFSFARGQQRFRSFWTRKLSSGMTLEVPEKEWSATYKNLLAQALIITQDGPAEVKYGAYEYEMFFGSEEGWPAVALALYGHGEEAQRLLSIMLTPALRNGCRHPWYAAALYHLSRHLPQDRRWLREIAPALMEAAEATLRAIHGPSKDPRFAGILPRQTYGGDIDTPAYSFTENAMCWRSLNDTAPLLRELGRIRQADRYQSEADAYRQRLWGLADQIVDRTSRPPFLPVSFEIGGGENHRAREPAYAFLGNNVSPRNTWEYLSNYWNISAPANLEAGLFLKGDPRAAWIPDYMEARGGIILGLSRFTLGADAIYGKGYAQSQLERGRREAFWTSLCALFAHGMSQDLNSFPEVAGIFPLRVNNRAMWREYERNLWNWGFQGWENSEGEALSAGPGVALQLLRSALLREDGGPGAEGSLRLLDGAPRHWFEPGKRIIVHDAPTFFGPVSFTTEASGDTVRASVLRGPGLSQRQVFLRLAHPAGWPLSRVAIDGRPVSDFAGEEIRLPARARVEVHASFAR